MNQSWLIPMRAGMLGKENTEVINRRFEFSFMYLTIPGYIGTLLLNMSVLMILRKKEKTIVNQLMKLDCIVNMVYSTLGTFQQSPCYKSFGLEMYCYPHMMLAYASVVFNRLLPVAIVVFRYFDFIQNTPGTRVDPGSHDQKFVELICETFDFFLIFFPSLFH